ncbi:MAG TPA: protein kinase, partial [Polyangiaceae bacterium]|nr:protein kinase [Polyangiaceae bacterium]
MPPKPPMLTTARAADDLPTPGGRPPEAKGQVDSVGKYRLLERIGRGGMGEVYLALNSGPTGFNKLVVVKLLREEFALNGAARAMFLDEARLVTRLNHPNVVQTNEVGLAGGDHYLVMEYLEGQSLDQLIKRADAAGERVPLGLLVRVALDVLSGLDYAHELADFDGTPLNVVHRDLSPHNVFLTYEGVVKLLDFGIAKAGTQSHRTEVGTLKGKPGYMPPEQLFSTPIDRRADLYVVGIVLWEMFTGARLFRGPPTQSAMRIVDGPMPPVSSVVPGFDPGLDAVVARALEREPDARFQTARAMREALAAAASSLLAVPPPEALGELMRSLFRDQRERRRLAVQRYVGEHLRGAGGAPREAARPPAAAGGAEAKRESVHLPALGEGATRDPSRSHGGGAGATRDPSRSQPGAAGAMRDPSRPPTMEVPTLESVLPALPSRDGGETMGVEGSDLLPPSAAATPAPPPPAKGGTLLLPPAPPQGTGPLPGPAPVALGRGALRSALVLCAAAGLATSGALVWFLRTGGGEAGVTAKGSVASVSPPARPAAQGPAPRAPAVTAASATTAAATPIASVTARADAARPRAPGRPAGERPAEAAAARASGKDAGERPAEPTAARPPAPHGSAAPHSTSAPAGPRPPGRTFRTDID